MDLFNKCFVGVQGEDIVILRPVSRMNKEEALIFAAWVVTLADDNNKFNEVLEAVHNI